MQRWKFWIVASALKGVPSENLTFGRSLIVTDLPSGVVSQLLASFGVIVPVATSTSTSGS